MKLAKKLRGSTRFAELKITIIWEVSSGDEIKFPVEFNENYFLNIIFCFDPRMKLKLQLYGEK